MRNLKSLLTIALASMSTLLASAINVTINVPAYADKLDCTVSGSTRVLHDGDNEFDVDQYSQISISAQSPYAISSITDKDGAGQYLNSGIFSKYVYSSDEGQVYTVNVINLDDSRTAEFTLKVDDPSKVVAILSGFNTTLTLHEGDNTIKFNPELEKTLTITGAQGASLYRVQQNGKNVASNGRWTLTLAAGDIINIMANYPDVDVTLSFTYSDGAKGCIGSVLVNGVAAPDFNGDELEVKMGSKVELVQNPDFKINSLQVNGSGAYWGYGNYIINTVVDNTTFYVDATPYQKNTVTVTVNKPELLKFYYGSSTYNNTPIALNAGENTLSVSENVTSVCWEYVGSGYAKSITINGNPVNSTSYYGITDGTKIVFDLAEIVMDQTAVIWMDDRSKITTYFNLANSKNQSVNIATGYNVIEFSEAYTPYALNWYQADLTIGDVYLNDELLEPQNPQYSTPSSRQYNLPLQNMDVVKIFVAGTPEDCEVNFVVEDGLSAKVVRDVIVPVENTDESLKCFKGTQIEVTPTDATTALEVTVNHTPLTADENGAFNFTVEDPDTVVKIKGLDNAVESIGIEPASNIIFDIAGRRINADFNALPAGLYIVNGKKVIK